MSNYDRSKSIFIGNIPYEATEENLRDMFNVVGRIVNFKLIYNKENGRHKGYGFCEYENYDMVQTALRKLKNIHFNGRCLKVKPASSENDANVETAKDLKNESIEREAFSQNETDISEVVASLAPDQLYQLMTNMKECIRNNPTEARQMLLQKPQLAYTLLHAQIVLKIIDPKVAIAMLTRTTDQIPQTEDEDETLNGGNSNSNNNNAFLSMEQKKRDIPPVDLIPLPSMNFGAQNMSLSHSNNSYFNSTIQSTPLGGNRSLPVTFDASIPPPQFSSFVSQHPPTSNANASLPLPKVEMTVNTEPMIAQKDDSDDRNAINDDEQTKMILKILSLPDDQIALLPEDQRRCVEILKSQLK